MKLKVLLSAVLLALATQVEAQEFCRPILVEAQTALTTAQLDKALEKLQDASTCDFKNDLLKDIQALEKKIFAGIQQQKEEALQQKALAEEALLSTEIQRKIAVTARDSAEVQRQLAVKAKDEAERQTEIAEQAEKEARRQEMLTICRSMAMKSTFSSDKRIKTLLALQAYKFYKREQKGVVPHNWAIFEALYDARKMLHAGQTNRMVAGESLGRYEVAFRDGQDNFLVSTPSGNISEGQFDHRIFIDTSEAKIGSTILKGSTWGTEVRLHPNGSLAAYLSSRREIRVADCRAPFESALRFGGREDIETYEFSGDGNNILVAYASGRVVEWDIKADKVINDFSFHEKLKEVQSHPRSGRIFACGKSGALMYQGLGSRIERIRELDGEQAETVTFARIDEKELMAIGTRSGKLYLLELLYEENVFRPAVLRVMEGHKGRITSLDFSHPADLRDGTLPVNYLASASMDETVRLWDISESGKYELPIVLSDYKTWVWQLRFSPDNSAILAVAHNGIIRTVPIEMETLASELCSGVDHDFSLEEWKLNVSNNRIPWEPTCGKAAPLKQ